MQNFNEGAEAAERGREQFENQQQEQMEIEFERSFDNIFCGGEDSE